MFRLRSITSPIDSLSMPRRSTPAVLVGLEAIASPPTTGVAALTPGAWRHVVEQVAPVLEAAELLRLDANVGVVAQNLALEIRARSRPSRSRPRRARRR